MNIIFNPEDCLMAFLGGALIGLSATILMLFKGRVAGISGIFFGVFTNSAFERLWRLLFVLGLLAGGFISPFFIDMPFQSSYNPSVVRIILAGLFVGLGTQMGSGCTSGHGVCGISRLSTRSIFATLLFISSGVLTVLIMGAS